MQKKILTLGLAAMILAGCQEQLASKTPATVTTAPTMDVLTLQTPAHVAAKTPHAPGVDITKVTVDPQTHRTTFYFSQGDAGSAFNLSVQPQPGDVCIHNMTTMYRLLAHTMNCNGTTYCSANNMITCGALAHTLKNNGDITNFLRKTGAICR